MAYLNFVAVICLNNHVSCQHLILICRQIYDCAQNRLMFTNQKLCKRMNISSFPFFTIYKKETGFGRFAIINSKHFSLVIKF